MNRVSSGLIMASEGGESSTKKAPKKTMQNQCFEEQLKDLIEEVEGRKKADTDDISIEAFPLGHVLLEYYPELSNMPAEDIYEALPSLDADLVQHLLDDGEVADDLLALEIQFDQAGEIPQDQLMQSGDAKENESVVDSPEEKTSLADNGPVKPWLIKSGKGESPPPHMSSGNKLAKLMEPPDKIPHEPLSKNIATIFTGPIDTDNDNELTFNLGETPKQKDLGEVTDQNTLVPFFDENMQISSGGLEETGPPEIQKESPVEPKKIFQQLAEKIEVKMIGEEHEVKIRLKPDHLGDIIIKISTDRGGVEAKFFVDNPEVRQVFQGFTHDLKNTFVEKGLNFTQISVYQMESSGGMNLGDHGSRGYDNQHRPPNNRPLISKLESDEVNIKDPYDSWYENSSVNYVI